MEEGSTDKSPVAGRKSLSYISIFSRQGTLDTPNKNKDKPEVISTCDVILEHTAGDNTSGNEHRTEGHLTASNTRDADQNSVLDLDELENKPRKGLLQSTKKKCWFFLYVGVMRGLMIGHEVALLYVHRFALLELEKNPDEVYRDALPSYLVALEIVGLPLLCLCRCWGRRHKCCGRVAIGGVYAYMIQGTLCYTIQIIVLMWKDMKGFLYRIPAYASCYCYMFNNPYYLTLNDTAASMFRCHCYVPYIDKEKVVLCHSDKVEHVRGCLSAHDVTHDGAMNITSGHNTTGKADAPGLSQYTHLYMLVLLLQLSLVVLVVTFPFWEATSQVLLEGKKDKAMQKAGEELQDGTDGPTQTRWSRIRQNVRVYVNKQKIKREYREKKLSSVQTAVGLSASGLAEGLDAFSLLEEMDARGDYFAADEFLTDAVLVFISITLLMMTFSLFLTIIPQSEAVGNGIKIAMIIINNLPFLILRSYMAQIFGGFGESSFIFLLFTIKEGMLIVLGLAEVGSALWGKCGTTYTKDKVNVD